MEVDEVVSQFGCRHTQDQEELVTQMMRLVGANVNMSAARFYLEMNQWNVQAAVCSYFDLEHSSSANLPGMVFVGDITIGEGESIPPSTQFVKTWRVENPGPDPWPPGVILRFSSGSQLAAVDRVLAGPLDPHTATDISVEMTSPSDPGIYESKWRMSTATGSFFGDTIWVIITVEPAGTMAITQQFQRMDHLGTQPSTHGASYNPFGAPATHTPHTPHAQDMMD